MLLCLKFVLIFQSEWDTSRNSFPKTSKALIRSRWRHKSLPVFAFPWGIENRFRHLCICSHQMYSVSQISITGDSKHHTSLSVRFAGAWATTSCCWRRLSRKSSSSRTFQSSRTTSTGCTTWPCSTTRDKWVTAAAKRKRVRRQVAASPHCPSPCYSAAGGRLHPAAGQVQPWSLGSLSVHHWRTEVQWYQRKNLGH